MDEQSCPASGIEALRELERFLEGAAQTRAGFSELERGSERRSRELARLELQAHIDSRSGGDVGEAIIILGAEGPVRLAYRRTRSRQLLSVFGRVIVRRTGYDAPGERTVYPLDQSLSCRPAPTAMSGSVSFAHSFSRHPTYYMLSEVSGEQVAYLGLDPRVHQSGSTPARSGRISKQG